MHPQKVICQKLLQISSIEEGQRQIFYTCFAYNFFLSKFFAFFSTVSKSAWNSALFWYPNSNFRKKKFLGHISTFLKLWSPIRKQQLKILKNVFYKSVLEFIFAPIFLWTLCMLSKNIIITVPYCICSLCYR